MRFKPLPGPQSLDEFATAENPWIIILTTRLFRYLPGQPSPAAELFAFSQRYPVSDKLPILRPRLAPALAEKGKNLIHCLFAHCFISQNDGMARPWVIIEGCEIVNQS